MLAAVASEMGEPSLNLPRFDVGLDPATVAAAAREMLGVAADAHMAWKSASAAFDHWREALERQGIAVLLFPLGGDNCRGFSLWNDHVPLVAVNTAWNDEARTFTLLHELGHLIARIDSACAAGDPAEVSGAWDPVERWCEVFAAAVLLPEHTLGAAVREKRAGAERVTTVAEVALLARRFNASLRATTIRLIELGLATWDIYRALPAATDAKRGGRSVKGGRDQQEIQEDSLGGRATDLVRRGMAADVISRSEALSYLDVPDNALDDFATPPA